MALGGLGFGSWTWIPFLTESERSQAVNQKAALLCRQTPSDVPTLLPFLVPPVELSHAPGLYHTPTLVATHMQMFQKSATAGKKNVKSMIVALMKSLMHIRHVRIVFNNHTLPSFPWDSRGTLGRI